MLDASVRAQILAVLVELRQRRNLALVFITHDLSLAWALCDRIAVMYLGRIVEQGSAVDVIERFGQNSTRWKYCQNEVAGHDGSSPTASRYVSSRVDVSTCTP